MDLKSKFDMEDDVVKEQKGSITGWTMGIQTNLAVTGVVA
jgi:hypothetical protein